MQTELLARINDRLLHLVGGDGAQGTINLFPPTTENTVAETEEQLGFKLPSLLKTIYLRIANGGFGPHYGLIGIKGGREGSSGTLVDCYNDFQRGVEYLKVKPWKPGMLPFCEYGSAIYWCVDCNDPGESVHLVEECVIYPQGYSLAEFFAMWLDGIDVMSFDPTPRVERVMEATNPFTRKKTQLKTSVRRKRQSPEN